jgi:hypothetical protein
VCENGYATCTFKTLQNLLEVQTFKGHQCYIWTLKKVFGGPFNFLLFAMQKIIKKKLLLERGTEAMKIHQRPCLKKTSQGTFKHAKKIIPSKLIFLIIFTRP